MSTFEDVLASIHELRVQGAALIATGFFINKVGSALLALAAARLEVPLYVCCHTAKFDLASIEGYDEPIEERDPAEVWAAPPSGVIVRNPAFDRVPAHSVGAFVTEHGLLDLGGVQRAAASSLQACVRLTPAVPGPDARWPIREA